MSQKANIRINALENRVTALERRLAELELPEELPAYRAVHRGFGHWFVETPDGTRMNTEGLKKEEAEAMAKDLIAMDASRTVA